MSAELRGKEAADYLEGLMEGFVAYDGNWTMTYMNAAGERLLGRRREEVLGRTWLSLRREGAAAEIRVRDNGIGIAPELLPRLFEKFSQGAGSIEAHSAGEGKGSEFVVSLPLR